MTRASRFARTRWCAALLALLPLAAPGQPAKDVRRVQISGGVLEWTVDRAALAASGVDWSAPPRISVPLRTAGTIGVDLTTRGGFLRFVDGSLLLGDGPTLRVAGKAVNLAGLQLRPSSEGLNRLGLVDEAGREWFRLSLGHHRLAPGAGRLDSAFMDLRPGPALRAAAGSSNDGDPLLGTVAFLAELLTDFSSLPKGDLCRAPRWPDGESLEVDLEITAMDTVSEAVAQRTETEVVITPSARFVIAGNADVPWYFRFATPEPGTVFFDPDCLDDGSGACAPYGTAQGGFLVWSLYRVRDGDILEQVGLSGVKHAFNSINDGAGCELACRGSSRVAWAGCEDLYTESTNREPAILGPRGEIEAHTATWKACGSVFDRDCDGACDNPGNGLIHCRADPAVDPRTELMKVAPEVLGSGDPMLIESWYVVRDDVNVLNSMATRPLAPVFDDSFAPGRWRLQPGAFRNGPALERLAADLGRPFERLDTSAGTVLLSAHARALGDGWTRYSYTVMNLTFDPALDELTLPLHPRTAPRNVFVTADPGNPGGAWVTDTGLERIRWRAPDGEPLDWGRMMSFGFESRLPPTGGGALLGVAGAFERAALDAAGPQPLPADNLFATSFEARP